MSTKIQSCSIQSGELTPKFYNNSMISAAPGVLTQSNTSSQQKQGIINSPAGHSPVIKKILTIGNDESSTSMTSDGSPGSALINSAPKKLRDLPHTTTLCGLVAFVDVWSSDGTDNRSSVFRNFLMRMGATIVRKFTKDQPITHVIFKDGHKSFLQKAQKRNIKVVTCLWVDRCRVLQKRVCEDDYLFDASNYKPPKRFFEMQPLEPEDAIRRSAERLKRRKARFAKKHARIMFQSPLVTHNHSANVTLKDGKTLPNQAYNRNHGILAADTPYNPPLPFRYFNPSIVYETPLSDSMQRMMKRMKEGKRVFSPPSSEESDNEDDEKSPTRPDDPIQHNPITPEHDREKFSPIADTQCFVKRTWRDSGLSPPIFDVSCDEIPETQQMEAPDTPQFIANMKPVPLSGIHEVPETQPMNISYNTTSDDETRLQEPLSQDNESNSEEQEKIVPASNSQDSVVELNLYISGNSSLNSNNTTTLGNANSNREDTSNVGPNVPALLNNFVEDKDHTPTDQKICLKPFVTSRKKKRKLLHDDDCVEPMSILASPQDSGTKSTVETRIARSGRNTRSSMLLPELGVSAYKSVAQSGRFFQKLRSNTPSECSTISEISPMRHRICNSQSTDYDDENNSSEGTIIHELPKFKEQLSLYDRIKMREKRNSTCSFTNHSRTHLDSSKKRRRLSENSEDSVSTENNVPTLPRRKMAKTQLEKLSKSPLFCSQAARAICESLKKRRSTLDFATPMLRDSTNLNTESTRRKFMKKNVVVLTNFHSNERFDVLKAIRTLSGFRISPLVRDQTTHVVCGATRRTMNVLRAIAKGVWLLSKNWVMDSLSAGVWLEEESYEISTSFPAAQKNRKCRNRNSLWENKLFAKFEGHIYISDDTKPSQEDIRELVSLCGGCLVGSPRRASVCVGNPGRIMPAIPVVSETWVLDCISENVLQPLEKYLI